MTTPRTMTQSQFEKHLHITHKGFGPVEFHECLRTCGGVTIVPDPEPRPDFEHMDIVDLAAWPLGNWKQVTGDVYVDDYKAARRALIALCHTIADAKGMAR